MNSSTSEKVEDMMQENKEQTSKTLAEFIIETAGTETDYFFTTDDILLVAEMLAGIAHKWKELATSLGLSRVARADCGNESSIQLRLYRVIEIWIEGEYSSKIPTTLRGLKKVLAGPIVLEGAIAYTLETNLMDKIGPHVLQKVSDAKLLYNKHDKEHLIKIYLNFQEVPRGSWPHVAPRNFITLALIESTEDTNLSHYSVRGDADDIIDTKEIIEYEKVFGKYDSGLTVLVLGRPGCGKTTLVHKVCKDWAKGKALEEAELVFLISLRVVNNLSDHSSLAQLLKCSYIERTRSENILKNIESQYGRGVCFIFDGFDEYFCSDKDNSVVYALLNKSYLSQAMIIMTSRPAAASDKLKNIPLVTRIEVFGFAREQMFKYIDSFPFRISGSSDRESHCSNLKAYLKINPLVLHMCYLPVNAAIICFLYDKEPNNMPQTQTKVYETFSRLIILRHLIDRGSSRQLNSIEELTGADAQHFKKMCQLAYKMTITSQQVISQDIADIKDTSLSLATIDITACVSGYQNTYTFLHLTLQEFLAAYHISRLPLNEQMEIINEHSVSVNMLTVWKFYFGLVNFEEGPERAESFFYKHRKLETSTLFKLHCAYESKQEIICKLASSESYNFVHEILTPLDMSALAYVMNTTAASYKSDIPTSTRPTTKLNFKFCSLANDAVKTLITKLSEEALRYMKT